MKRLRNNNGGIRDSDGRRLAWPNDCYQMRTVQKSFSDAQDHRHAPCETPVPAMRDFFHTVSYELCRLSEAKTRCRGES
jgi:hypothetical protein